jgi:hypothetical protein
MSFEDNRQPLLENKPEESFFTKAKRACLKCTLCTVVSLFLLAWLLQGICYWYGLYFSCTGSPIAGWEPADDSDWFNLLSPHVLLNEKRPNRYGDALDSVPASKESSTMKGAPSGVWWATWGPFFTTYIYQDLGTQKPLIYARRNLLRLGMSHRIARCDGQGPYVTLNEGTLWFQNRFRTMAGLNQGISMKLFLDDLMYAKVKETKGDTISFNIYSEERGDVGSAVLKDHHFGHEGKRWQWLVVTDDKANGTLPYWVTEGAAAIFAFSQFHHHNMNEKGHKPDSQYHYDVTRHPEFLATTSNTTLDAEPVSVPAVEAAAAVEAVVAAPISHADEEQQAAAKTAAAAPEQEKNGEAHPAEEMNGEAHSAEAVAKTAAAAPEQELHA